MGRSVSAAAAQAVEKSNRKSAVERTPDQVIDDIRKNASAGLSVTSADILLLFSKYVEAQGVSQGLRDVIDVQDTTINDLKEQNEQFRNVYELENRSSSVKIEKVDEFENVKMETTVGNAGGDAAEDIILAGVAGALNASTSGE